MIRHVTGHAMVVGGSYVGGGGTISSASAGVGTCVVVGRCGLQSFGGR